MTQIKHHQNCDCCDGTQAITPMDTTNRPGLDQIQYRIGTHPTFYETMKARLSSTYVEQPRQSIKNWKLKEADIRNMPRFLRRLQKAGDSITVYLRTQIGNNPQLKCDLDEYDGGKVNPDLTQAILEALNSILGQIGLYTPDNVRHLDLTVNIRSLLAQNDLSSDEIEQLNRLLLDLAYPDLIIPKLRLYPLNDLTTRQLNDPSLAMLDAWSTVADVLTFYQERIANEGYLPTATERRSILELANLVGYKLRPGVAASTFLAFTVENGHELIIPQGTRAQSIPGPNELPQSFETSQDLYAKDVWSSMPSRQTSFQLVNAQSNTIYLEGLQNSLKPNSPLLIVPISLEGEIGIFRQIKSIKIDPLNQRTILLLSGNLELGKLQKLAIGSDNEVKYSIDSSKWQDRRKPASVPRINIVPNPNEEAGVIKVEWDILEPDHYRSGEETYSIKIFRAIEDNNVPGGYSIGTAPLEELNNIEPIVEEGLALFSITSSIVSPHGQYYIKVETVDYLNSSSVTSRRLGIEDSRGSNPLYSVRGKTIYKEFRYQSQNVDFASISPTIYWKDIFRSLSPFIDPTLKLTLNGIKVEITEEFFSPQLESDKTNTLQLSIKENGNDQIIGEWQFSTTYGDIEISGVPKFTWSPNNKYQFLYITRNLSPSAVKRWNFSQLEESNPLDSGALVEIPISGVSFQPKFPIINSKGNYYWKLSAVALSAQDPPDPITIKSINDGEWFIFNLRYRNESIQPSENQLDALIQNGNIHFRWDAILELGYEIEIDEYGLNNGNYEFVRVFPVSGGQKVNVEPQVGEAGNVEINYECNYGFKPGTRYRWRIKADGDIHPSPWWEFTTLGASPNDTHYINIYNALIQKLYLRVFPHAQDEPEDPEIEPLLTFLKNDQASATKLQTLHELQKPALQRDREIFKEIFQALIYPDSNYAFNNAIKWIEELEVVLIEIEEQLNLLPLQSTQESLPFLDKQLDLTALSDFEDLFENQQPEGEDWEKIIDIISLLNGDYSIKNLDEAPNDEYQLYGLRDLVISLKDENFSDLEKKSKDLEKITRIERQLKRVKDYKIAVLELEAINSFDSAASDWLQEIINALTKLRVFRAPDEGSGNTNQFNQGFLFQLQKTPSVQILERSVNGDFFEDSNFATQLLTTFVPKLKGLYYEALSTKKLSPEIDKQGVYLFNVKSALYSANSIESEIEYQENGSPKTTVVFKPNPISAVLISLKENEILLDREYKEILRSEDSWIVLEQQREDDDIHRVSYKIDQVSTISKPGFGKVTRLLLSNPTDPDNSWQKEFLELPPSTDPTPEQIDKYRNIIAYVQNEELILARDPIKELVLGNKIDLDGLHDEFISGRRIIVSGTRADIDNTLGIQASEVGVIAKVQEIGVFREIEVNDEIFKLEVDRSYTRLILANNLAYSYVRETVIIQANVIEATHGETRSEILGSGDAAQANQTFNLKQKPLTHVAAPTSSGVDSELTVYVNDVAWDETDNLVFLDQEERGFMSKIDNEDNVSVIFGDGKRGARLPTGVENVKAVYRSGIGKAGNVVAEQISMLATKPLGVKDVINPLAAIGGVDREKVEQARKNTPIPLFALDRLVSFKDYEDFARAFAGIDKVKAESIVVEASEVIHLTVALVDDVPFGTNSQLYRNLLVSLQKFGTLNRSIFVSKRSLSLIISSINIKIAEEYIWEVVEGNVRHAILHYFGFDNRALGQDVLKSELLSVIQGVSGVVYADVDLLATISETDDVEELQKAIAALGSLGADDRIEITKEATYLGLNSDEEITISPIEIAYFSPNIPDALILKEVRS